jgi:hypothetical protein
VVLRCDGGLRYPQLKEEHFVKRRLICCRFRGSSIKASQASDRTASHITPATGPAGKFSPSSYYEETCTVQYCTVYGSSVYLLELRRLGVPQIRKACRKVNQTPMLSLLKRAERQSQDKNGKDRHAKVRSSILRRGDKVPLTRLHG